MPEMEKRILKENKCQITNFSLEIGTNCHQCMYMSREGWIEKICFTKDFEGTRTQGRAL